MAASARMVSFLVTVASAFAVKNISPISSAHSSWISSSVGLSFIVNSNSLPGLSEKFSKPFGGFSALQTVVLGGKAVRGGINARNTNDLPLHLGRGICDRALYAHGMSFHPGRTVCDTLALPKGLELDDGRPHWSTKYKRWPLVATRLAFLFGTCVCNTNGYNIPMPTRKPKPTKPNPPASTIVVRLTEAGRAQLHYLLIERALTMPDEKPTISRLVSEAIGALARSKGWKQ